MTVPSLPLLNTVTHGRVPCNTCISQQCTGDERLYESRRYSLQTNNMRHVDECAKQEAIHFALYSAHPETKTNWFMPVCYVLPTPRPATGGKNAAHILSGSGTRLHTHSAKLTTVCVLVQVVHVCLLPSLEVRKY